MTVDMRLGLCVSTDKVLTPQRRLSPVVVHQHVDEVFEEVGLAGAEEAFGYLVHGLLQLRDTVVVRRSVIAEDKRHSTRY